MPCLNYRLLIFVFYSDLEWPWTFIFSSRFFQCFNAVVFASLFNALTLVHGQLQALRRPQLRVLLGPKHLTDDDDDDDDDDSGDNGDDKKWSRLTGSVRYVVKATEAAVNIYTDLTTGASIGVGRTLVHV